MTNLGELLRPHLRPLSPSLAPALRDALREAASGAPLPRDAQDEMPGPLAVAALELLESESDPRQRHWLTTLLTEENLWVETLLSQELLDDEAAAEIVRLLASREPQVDVMLLRRLVAGAAGNVARIPEQRALRALAAVEKLGDHQRLLPLLTQLLRHPSARVQSKVALLMGRANYSAARLSSLLEAPDPRVRANAIEALWHAPVPAVIGILRKALADPAQRVRVNALIGLALLQDPSARRELEELAAADDPGLRAAAAWGIGRVGDPEMRPLLENLAQDRDPGVRRLASRWLTDQAPA